jgi:hypothetical protein
MVDIQTFMDMFRVFCLGVVTGIVLAGSIPVLVFLGIISPKVLPGQPDYKPDWKKEKEVMKDV